ncbi:MAG TPA: aminotransferase class V-fold PLP-dependent enzyme [Flavobacteriales bacterium]|nr:aminotransferase class V-fold PLP-dependent enzyme [Flavobacteriales bacterium]HPH83037.1 aminotransferase class V-fold PLP-dependent enzyme [Flavobacteriales bacterium]
MTPRRSFLKNLGISALSIPFLQQWNTVEAAELETHFESFSLDQAENDEDFWYRIQQSYSVSPNIINLNNGGVSPQPKVVQETFENFNRLSNEGPSYYMWRILDQGREPLRNSLAELAGCSADELAINRNATEALGTIIMGIPLEKGDEIVLSRWDYPNMINAWKWREKRDGIKLVWVEHPHTSENADELTKRYTDAFTSKTKVVHITHLINWNGQVIPVAKIAQKAREKGILSISDSAHSFAHLDFKIPDLQVDFCGTSLHKWLCAPFGSGLLYVRKDKIANLAPLFPGEKPESEDIRKFETLGTRSFPTELAIGRAIDFHNGIGSTRKFERLHQLKTYWTEKVKTLPGVTVHTPASAQFSGAIGLFSIEGMKPSEIEPELFKPYGIHTVGIDWNNISGVRVTPHVYTPFADLDVLVKAITTIAEKAQKKG